MRDSASQGFSENLYTLAELAQYLIKVLAAKKSWPLNAYPGHVKMPADIFKPLPDRETALEVRCLSRRADVQLVPLSY